MLLRILSLVQLRLAYLHIDTELIQSDKAKLLDASLCKGAVKSHNFFILTKLKVYEVARHLAQPLNNEAVQDAEDNPSDLLSVAVKTGFSDRATIFKPFLLAFT